MNKSAIKKSIPIVIILGIIIVYANSLHVPFFFDDIDSIAKNATIRDLFNLKLALSPPYNSGITVAGRPLLNLSLAINYAISGLNVWSYHVLNLLIHVMATLTLYGIIRRTLVNNINLNVSEIESLLLAGLAALIWGIHPLQTESVTYTIQRAESLMGLFYLSTLYFYIRGSESNYTQSAQLNKWLLVSLVAELAGMATKEVMISAPMCIFAYAWCFQSTDIRQIIRRRWVYFIALITTALTLIILAIRNGTRGGTSGFGIGISPWNYWLTQFQAICHYIYLSLWPTHLVFDYGAIWVTSYVSIIPYIVVTAGLVIFTIKNFYSRKPVGFLGIVFLIILAPTSLIPGARQTIAEHRMYLPLIPIIVFTLWIFYYKIINKCKSYRTIIISILVISLVVALGIGTAARNNTYQNTLILYKSDALNYPNNYFVHNNLGNVLAEQPGYTQQAEEEYKLAIKLNPHYWYAHTNLGNLYAKFKGKEIEAINECKIAVELRPDYADARYDLAIAYSKLKGTKRLAIEEFKNCLRLKPDFSQAHNNLGAILTEIPGKESEALDEFNKAIKLDSGYFEAIRNIAELLLKKIAAPKLAIPYYILALKLNPSDYVCLKGLSSSYILNNEPYKAIDPLNKIIALNPDNAEAYLTIALIHSATNSTMELAVVELKKAIELKPDYIQYILSFPTYISSRIPSK